MGDAEAAELVVEADELIWVVGVVELVEDEAAEVVVAGDAVVDLNDEKEIDSVALGLRYVAVCPITDTVYGVPLKLNTSLSLPESQEQLSLQQYESVPVVL